MGRAAMSCDEVGLPQGEGRGIMQLRYQRGGRCRLAVLGALILVLVSCVVLVGNSQHAGRDEAAAVGPGNPSYASLFSKLRSYPDFAAMKGSFQRLSTNEQLPGVSRPAVPGVWGVGNGPTAIRQPVASASEQQRMLKAQETMASTEAAVGMVEHVLGFSSPQMLQFMPKALQNIVYQSAMHAAMADAHQVHGIGALSQEQQLGALAAQMKPGQPLPKALEEMGAAHGLSPAQMMAAAQQLQQIGQGTGLLQPGQQQLQEQAAAEQPMQQEAAAAEGQYVQPQEGAVAPAAAAPDAQQYAQAPAAETPYAQQYVQPGVQAGGGGEYTSASQPEADTSTAPQVFAYPPAVIPAAGAVQAYDDPATSAAAQPTPGNAAVGQARFHIHPDFVKATYLIGLAGLACVVPLLCFVAMCRCTQARSEGIKDGQNAHDVEAAEWKTVSALGGGMPPTASMPRGIAEEDLQQMRPRPGSLKTGGTGGSATESSSSLVPGSLRFLQDGLDAFQGGMGDLAETIKAATAMPSFDFEQEDTAPYAVVISFTLDSQGCFGIGAANEIYDQCVAKGLKTLLLPSDPHCERGSDSESERLAHAASSALFVALVDDNWVLHEAHLRLLAIAVQCHGVRSSPRLLMLYDKELRYKDDVALRDFKFSSSNSVAVRRHDSILQPYEMMDHFCTTKGIWDELLNSDPADRGLTEEEGAAILGGALPLEARLKSQVNRRRVMLQATEEAAKAGGKQAGSGAASPHSPHSQQMILPTFTRPDIRFNPYIP